MSTIVTTQRPQINLLWTGGLDSTFRLWELSRNEVDVQPYYIVDTTRGSIPQERIAMEKILKMLRSDPLTKANISDIKYIDFSTILPDDEITESWKKFYDWNQLGSQYDYLARFAKQNNLKLEFGLECSLRSKATTVLKKFGNLIKDSYLSNYSKWSEFYHVSEDGTNQDCIKIFQYFNFPAHLFEIEKVEEVEIMKNNGAFDIAKATWFCHRPICGLTCGQCNPCKDALNEGMEWRVSKIGRILVYGRSKYYGARHRLARLLKH